LIKQRYGQIPGGKVTFLEKTNEIASVALIGTIDGKTICFTTLVVVESVYFGL